jgi:hypothetical protein
MLLFRSEEHVGRWCEAWRMPRGAVLPPELAWQLAHAWYAADRRDPGWRRRTADETRKLFAELGLTGAFWELPAAPPAAPATAPAASRP